MRRSTKYWHKHRLHLHQVSRSKKTTQITQDKNGAPPPANTRQQRQTRTLTQEFMLECSMEIPGYKAPFTAKQAASRKYPLQFLCDLAYTVLDDETGNLLEYRHLMKHPKYKDEWIKSFGTEICPLAKTTETSSLFGKKTYHATERATRHMQVSYALFVMARR
jgi:hypothetical protein